MTSNLNDVQRLLEGGRYREGLAAARAILDSSAPTDLCELVAAALQDCIDRYDDGRSAVFEDMCRTVIELQTKAFGHDSEPVYVAWWSLAAFLDGRGRTEEAKRAYRQMIAVAEKLAAAEPALLERAQTRYADLLGRTGDHASAEKYLRRAIASLQRDDPLRQARESRMGKKGPDLIEVLSDLHQNLTAQGKAEEARGVLARIEELRKERDG
jgi:tetratricopeptide (TPR) repeat protein